MSTIIQDVKIKGESPVAPDSTTVDRQYFTVGEDVLLHDEDGLFYFGTVVKVDLTDEKGLVQFGDDTSRWSKFQDLKKIKLQEETDISCILCKGIQSVASNQVLLCHYCRRGYHQNCHQPPIPKQFAESGTHWMCTKCVERRQTRERNKCCNPNQNAVKLGNNNNKNTTLTVDHGKALPYDLATLSWDSQHLTNKEEKYCYCGQNGEWFRHMFQCCKCVQWFHRNCTSFSKQKMLLGDRFFIFLCSICNGGGEERLMRLSEELALVDIAHLALYTLTSETSRTYHDIDRHILPFLENKWKQLSPSKEILSMASTERRSQILSSFWQFKARFIYGREMKKKTTTWGLRSHSPPAFPSALSSQSLGVLKRWTGSEILAIASQSADTSPSSPNSKKTAERVGRKRTRASLSAPEPADGNCRKLRARQQRVSSEESQPEDDSSDDVKKQQQPTGNYQNKNNYQTKKSGRSEDNSSSHSSSTSALVTPAETSGDETSSRSTLELFIPPPKNFHGLNNPFASLTDGLHRPGGRSRSSLLLVRPLKTRLSEKDIRITKNGQVKRRKLSRKMKQSQPVAGNSSHSFFHANSTFSLINGSHGGTFSLPYSDPKDSVLSYFGVEERVSRGEKYSVRATRVLPKGVVQYLLEWEADRQATS